MTNVHIAIIALRDNNIKMELIKNLQWHYAVKIYTDERVNEEKIDQIIESINLSASSCGIQPYRLIVVTNPEIREKLA